MTVTNYTQHHEVTIANFLKSIALKKLDFTQGKAGVNVIRQAARIIKIKPEEAEVFAPQFEKMRAILNQIFKADFTLSAYNIDSLVDELMRIERYCKAIEKEVLDLCNDLEKYVRQYPIPDQLTEWKEGVKLALEMP